jgi:transposase
VVKALRYGLQVTLRERTEVIARKPQETGYFVLLTNVPTAGAMAHRAGDVLRAYKGQHSIEQNFGFLKDPLIVNSLFLNVNMIEPIRIPKRKSWVKLLSS